MASIQFQNVTQFANIDDVGESWGTAFGDYNQDGWLDIWLNNHLDEAKLYLNQRDGSFVNVFPEEVERIRRQDNHGAAWADFNNDGNLDLIQLNGGGGGQGAIDNFLLVNDGTQLRDRATQFNLGYPLGRGRMPLWWDFNRDGKLDLFNGTADRPDGQAPPTIFQQTNQGFRDVGQQLGLNLEDGVFAQISYLTGKETPELLVFGADNAVFETSRNRLTNVTEDLNLDELRGGDVAIADFNGDLRPDIFQVSAPNKPHVFQSGDRSFKTFFQQPPNSTKAQGANFETEGVITVEIPAFPVDQIFIGRNAHNPSSRTFELDASRGRHRGIAPFTPGESKGLYIGFNVSENQWEVRWSSPDNSQIFSRLTSTAPIENLQSVGININEAFRTDKLWLNTPNGFVESETANLDQPTAGESVAAGDFDNDMDIDLYVLSTTKVGNVKNVFYKNLGNGTFRAVEEAAGAEGTSLGLGSAVAQADVNNDGFLDLLVTNGGSFLGNARSILLDGPTELFLNEGNDNHWINIQLVGQTSNRDAIGTQVFATAGGKTQLREQNGGIQAQVQNDTRVHFGLGDNDRVEELQINWTNGLTQTLFDVKANRILTIKEGVGHQGVDVIIGSRVADEIRGRAGADNLQGKSGADTIWGGTGADTLEGNSGNDELKGGQQDDVLYGQDGDDTLLGEAGNDQLFGGKANDQLTGGNGDDWLVGGGGDDSLAGGLGADRFHLNHLEKGVVTIEDFVSTQDRLILSKADFDVDLPIRQFPFIAFKQGPQATSASHRLIYQRSRGTLQFDADGSGNQNPVLVAQFTPGTLLKAPDIEVVA